jgi:glycerol-3-phosphate dehydrogenase
MAQEVIEHFENIIVGGGIVGAGIFRDLSLHKQEVLLIDRGEFCSQTSARSSKMLHGGIRYLENFDFALVKEALAEKNFWVKHSPNLIKEKMFIAPVYKTSKWSLPFMIIGVFLYDLLSLFRNPRFNFYFKKLVPVFSGNI